MNTITNITAELANNYLDLENSLEELNNTFKVRLKEEPPQVYVTYVPQEKYNKLKEAAQEALIELERINKLIVLVNTAAITNLQNALV